MLTEKYANELKEIISALKNCYFEDLEDEEVFENDVIEPFKEKYKHNFTYNSGATKGVLIFDNLGFVIKIPFSYCDGITLCGAYDGFEDWDYCSQEVNRYDFAEEQKVEQIFLKTELIDYINGFPIYIQEYAEPLSHITKEHLIEHKSSTDNDIDEIDKIINKENYEYINSEWEADVLVYYGKDFYLKFRDFIKEYDISDLRTPNIGYIGKQPIILDYAGFYD